MRFVGLMVLVVATVGCSADPESSRLAVGSKAIVVEHRMSDGSRHRQAFLRGTDHGLWPALPLGTHLTVVDDSDASGPLTDMATREVTVHVEDGEYQGVTGTLTRWDLHPVE